MERSNEGELCLGRSVNWDISLAKNRSTSRDKKGVVDMCKFRARV